jgi:hypothetical protein
MQNRLAKVARVTPKELRGIQAFRYSRDFGDVVPLLTNPTARTLIGRYIEETGATGRLRGLRGSITRDIAPEPGKYNAPGKRRVMWLRRDPYPASHQQRGSLGKGRYPLGEPNVEGSRRYTLRHEIGHNVWYNLPHEVQNQIAHEIITRRGLWGTPEKRVYHAVHEDFADAFARQRGQRKSRHWENRRMEQEFDRDIVAAALRAIRTQRRGRR